jgi:hypothetical protein
MLIPATHDSHVTSSLSTSRGHQKLGPAPDSAAGALCAVLLHTAGLPTPPLNRHTLWRLPRPHPAHSLPSIHPPAPPPPHPHTHTPAVGLTRRSMVPLGYFLSVMLDFLSTMQRPKPRSRLERFITMASSMSYPGGRGWAAEQPGAQGSDRSVVDVGAYTPCIGLPFIQSVDACLRKVHSSQPTCYSVIVSPSGQMRHSKKQPYCDNHPPPPHP